MAFCCRGCASVYDVALQQGLLDHVLAAPRHKRSLQRALLPTGETAYFQLDGMWCPGCAVAAERILGHQPGVAAAEVSFASERGYLRYDPAQTDLETALASLHGLGYRTRLTGVAEEGLERKLDWTVVLFLVAVGFGMHVMALYLNQLYHLYAAGRFSTPTARGLQYLMWLEATPVLFLGGGPSLLGAVRALRARTATMDTLVSLGTLAAYGYSVYVTLTGRGHAYFDSVVMITVFVALGRCLEASGGVEARKGIRELLRLQPARARRRRGDGWEEVAARDLAAGDIILVLPGERVPADAGIVEGHAALDESLLTGESIPLPKGPGGTVLAGTLPADGALTCRVLRLPREARLAQITQLVERTLAARPPIQRLADRASAWLTVAVLAIAGLTALGWWVSGHALARGLLAAVAVLVVACPCSLGLATPLALATILGRMAQEGILVRNPAALETAARIRRMAFDKTGTLTRGRMDVVAVEAAPGLSLDGEGLLRLAAAVEQYSEHPLAKAILAAAAGTPPAAREFQALRGLGASAVVLSLQVKVGSLRFLQAEVPAALAGPAEAHTQRGETVAWVGWGNTVAGFIALRDEPNPTAAAALRRLEAAGICPALLSGDNPQTVRRVAEELGLAAHEGNCSPAEKAARIGKWQDAGEPVAMVGDGVNDAPALAQADLSITVAGGTDVAGHVSDVILTRADLNLIPQFVGISRRARRIIGLNLGWAFAYNLIAVPLAALGLISPAIAAATMAASSITVVLNSLRLRR